MLYLAIEPDYLRFFSVDGDVLQKAVYRMSPTLTFERNLQQALAKMPNSGNANQAVRVIVTTAGTAMPLNDFTEETCGEVFQHCFGDRRTDRVFYDMIPEANAVWLFGLPKAQCTAIEAIFGEVFYTSIMATLARYAMNQAKPQEDMVAMGCRDGWVDMILVSDAHLMVANGYAVNASSDVGYYLTTLLQQFHTEVESARVVLVGEKSVTTSVEEEIAPFIPHLGNEGDIIVKLLKYMH